MIRKENLSYENISESDILNDGGFYGKSDKTAKSVVSYRPSKNLS